LRESQHAISGSGQFISERFSLFTVPEVKNQLNKKHEMRLAEMRASVCDALQTCIELLTDLRVHAERWNACRSESLRTLMRKPMKHIVKETCVFEKSGSRFREYSDNWHALS
jgi:hypothetical protein